MRKWSRNAKQSDYRLGVGLGCPTHFGTPLRSRVQVPNDMSIALFMQGEDPSQLPWQRNAAAASHFHAAPPHTPRANSSFRSRPTIKPKLVLELKMVWRHEKMKSKPFAKRSSTRGWTRWIRHPTLFAEPHRTRYHGPCRPPNAWLTQ